MSGIQTLTSDVARLADKVDWWNTAIIVMMVVAALAATGLVLTQYIAFRRAAQLSDAQTSLSEAKDRQSVTDSKVKDQKIADALQTAGDSNKAAGEANERANALEVESLRLREQLVAQGPREALLRGDNRKNLIEALKPFMGQRIDVRRSASVIEVNGAVVMSTPVGDDTTGLAVTLIGVAKDAGWEPPSEPLLASVVGRGIEILVVRGASEKTMQAAIVLGNSLQAVSFEKVRGPVFADESRAARVGKDATLPSFDKDTIVVEVLSHP